MKLFTSLYQNFIKESKASLMFLNVQTIRLLNTQLTKFWLKAKIKI